MTEKEWLGGKQPKQMLNFVQDKSSDRKLRLFVCGYFRTLLPHYHDEPTSVALEALETSERFADGLANAEEMEACRTKARTTARAGNEPSQLAVSYAAFLNVPRAVEQVFGNITTETDRRNKAQLLHDLWGPLPFRNLPIERSWLTPKVVKLAQSIYDDRAFDRLPVLADALEDAGCHDADILSHCKESVPHVRGCWVLDLILGKA
jgi:hypothetical protein